MPQRDSQTNKNRSGVWYVIAREARLVTRLLMDKRVPWYLKLLPIGSIFYVLWPADLIPLNPLDDAAIVSAAFYFFLELCPPEVVEEHRQNMKGVIAGKWFDPAPYEQVPEQTASTRENPKS